MLKMSFVLVQRRGSWTTGSWCNGEGAVPLALPLFAECAINWFQ